jgi:hypothetical protein
VLAAIEAVSGHVVCLCCGAVEVTYSPERDRPVIVHPYPSCWCVASPHGPSATALAEHVLDEMAAYVSLAEYGEPLPLHEAGLA